MSTSATSFRALLTVAAALVFAAAAHAGAILFPGSLTDDGFVPDKKAAAAGYTIRYSSITAAVDPSGARTKIQETIVGPSSGEVRAVCLIPLPADVDAGSPVVTVGTDDGAARKIPAKFLPADEARKVCEAVAKGTGTVRILSLVGRPALLIADFALGPKLDLTIAFTQRPAARHGVREFRCPMPAAAWARGAVARLSMTVTVTDTRPLRAVFSPTHHAAIERKGLRRAEVRVKADKWAGGEEFGLYYVADRDDLGLRVLAHHPDPNADGYFLLVGNPTGGAVEQKVLEKDVLFVLDTSGSMRGEKIEQARSAIEYCLNHLNAGDRFNIVTFGTEVRSFRDAPAANTKANVAAGRDFIDEIVARGRTNISGALAKGLAGKPAAGRLRIMIFLTDGTPTAGELVPEKIVESLATMNTSATQMFVMGVGHDVNAHLLDKLAAGTDGSSEYVQPGEDIDVKIAALHDRLSHPVLSNVEVAFGDLRTHSVFPKKLPALFRGSEIMIAGRYRKGGRHTVTLSGTLAGKAVTYPCQAEFPTAAAGECEFAASLWAARKTGYLLREIRLNGENKELIEEIVRLSKKFGIVTEYTSFIATTDIGVADSTAALEEARGRLRAARVHQAGQWAVNQAMNELDLLKRVVTADEANLFRNRRGEVVKADNVRQVGGRVFYLRNGKWVDADGAGKRKTRVVKLLSKEYFELLRADRDFARAQALGGNVSMNVGGERIVVEK